jgi:hypothetical protein
MGRLLDEKEQEYSTVDKKRTQKVKIVRKTKMIYR